ncbi:MAG: glycosyltransferase family 1 protein [Vicingaceae bacterium]
MNIGFDAKRYFFNATGLGNYSRDLVNNIAAYYPNNHYFLYTPKAILTDFKLPANISVYESKATFQNYWRRYGIVQQLLKDNIQIYHGLSNELPVGIDKTSIQTVVTIHDVIYKTHPKTYPLIDRNIYDKKVSHACKIANVIVATSESTKRDILKFYEVDENKIKVVYQTCNPVFINQTAKSEGVDFELPEKYFLYVGTINERKNLLGVLHAIHQMPKKERIPLIVVGKGGKYHKKCLHFANSKLMENDVIWLNHLKAFSQLKHLYQNAVALVYPSFYEGFGIPIIESLFCKTPVITSIVSSLPEAAGGGGLLVNPNIPAEIKNAMQSLLQNQPLRNELIEKGYEHVTNHFTPQKISESIMNIYRSLSC